MLPHMVETVSPAHTPAGLVEALKRAWRDGVPPDAAAALREHPELLRHRSLVVDLAYEEYCLREEARRPPDPDQFCRGLPAFGSHVREVLRGHRLLADHPELFEPADAPWPRPGDRFEGLTVVRELGRGAFARAYLALDPDTGDRPVALKLSPAPSAEGRTLGPIRHPHVVGVHWARRTGGLYAVCMPFVGAATLRDAIDAAFAAGGPSRSARAILGAIEGAAGEPPAGPAPAPPLLTGRESYPDAVAAVAGRLADALAHLHLAGVTHGDLKPSNVLLGPGGHPYLIDFNLATGRDDSLLRCGGTLPYMAPERVRLLLGEPADAPTARADVYSLGVVLFEALTGKLPFEPADLPDLDRVAAELSGRQAAGAPRVRAADPAVPRRLARVVERCLATDPRRRPSAEAVRRELDRYARRRARLARVLAAGAGLAAAGVVAGLLAGGSPAAPVGAAPPAVAPAHPAPLTPDDLIARGFGHLRTGDVSSAMKDFGDVYRGRPDGRTAALLAYSHSRAGQDRAAAELYRGAIDGYGYQAAWALNNRAYARIQLTPSSHKELSLAIGEATAALGLDPHLRAARLNRAWAGFLLHRDRKTQTLADPGCLADLEAVLAGGPPTADLCYKAAVILVAAGVGRDDGHARALGYLEQAVGLGKPAGILAGDPVFKVHLSGRPEFDRVLRLPRPARPGSAPNLHLADPPNP
jgi:hypothetical protein